MGMASLGNKITSSMGFQMLRLELLTFNNLGGQGSREEALFFLLFGLQLNATGPNCKLATCLSLPIVIFLPLFYFFIQLTKQHIQTVLSVLLR